MPFPGQDDSDDLFLMIYICLARVDWKPVFVLFPQSNEVSS
jgi:hypothetical protein